MITGTSPSGLTYAVKRSGSAVAWCALTLRCGTRDEQGFPCGIAHFAEHTLFRGTARKGASLINGYLDRLGGELNAYTTKEEIVLHATVLKEDLGKAERLLLELATEAVFPPRGIETERGVVLDEIISYKDNPAEDVYDRFEGELFRTHPLEKPILGTLSSVRKICRDDLVRFTRTFFTPGNMTFSVVADLDESKMERDILRLSAKLGAAPAPARTLLQEGTQFIAPVFEKVVDKRHHEVNAVVGTTAPSLADGRDRVGMAFLANILGGLASNSLLNKELRERHGWVYGVECSYTQYADTGIFAITFGCDRPNLDKCLSGIGTILDGIRQNPLSEARLAACRKQTLGQMAIAAASGEVQCLSMGKSLQAFGRVVTGEETRTLLETFSADELCSLAARHLAPERLSRLIYL